MSDPKTVLQAAVAAADQGPFSYFLYGGMAAAIWGEPRYTEDADIVLFLPEREAPRFLRAAASCGFAVDESLAMQQIQISGWARVPYGDPESPWHLDLTLGDTPFDESALKRRKQVTLYERSVWVASPEDMIIYKLVSARGKDLADVEAIGRCRKGLDASYLRQWAAWWRSEGVEAICERVERVLTAAAP